MDFEFGLEQVEIRLRKDGSIYAPISDYEETRVSGKRTRRAWCPFVSNRVCHDGDSNRRVILQSRKAAWLVGADSSGIRLDKTRYTISVPPWLRRVSTPRRRLDVRRRLKTRQRRNLQWKRRRSVHLLRSVIRTAAHSPCPGTQRGRYLGGPRCQGR
jgi:hypothetical protein